MSLRKNSSNKDILNIASLISEDINEDIDISQPVPRKRRVLEKKHDLHNPYSEEIEDDVEHVSTKPYSIPAKFRSNISAKAIHPLLKLQKNNIKPPIKKLVAEQKHTMVNDVGRRKLDI